MERQPCEQIRNQIHNTTLSLGSLDGAVLCLLEQESWFVPFHVLVALITESKPHCSSLSWTIVKVVISHSAHVSFHVSDQRLPDWPKIISPHEWWQCEDAELDGFVLRQMEKSKWTRIVAFNLCSLSGKRNSRVAHTAPLEPTGMTISSFLCELQDNSIVVYLYRFNLQ